MMRNPQADNCGQIPQVGDFVAYNYSGEIATGFITHKGKGRWDATFTIHQVKPTEGHISHVRGGPRCLLVLETEAEQVRGES